MTTFLQSFLLWFHGLWLMYQRKSSHSSRNEICDTFPALILTLREKKSCTTSTSLRIEREFFKVPGTTAQLLSLLTACPYLHGAYKQVSAFGCCFLEIQSVRHLSERITAPGPATAD